MEAITSICHKCQHGAEPGSLTHCNSVEMVKEHLNKAGELFEADLTGLRYVPYIQVVEATVRNKCKWYEERHADEQKPRPLFDKILRQIIKQGKGEMPTQGTK